jgi:hypothetical protein
MRKGLPCGSEAEVESRKQEISASLESCSLDIKTERSLLNELQILCSSMDGIRELSSEIERVNVLRDEEKKILQLRQAKIDEITSLREDEKKLLTRLESVRDGEGSAEVLKVNSFIASILDQKAAMVSTLKGKRSELQDLNIKYKIRLAEYR